MIEVEVRARVDSFDAIKEALKSINAKFIRSEKQTDKIFGHPMFLDSNNMIIEGGIVPRIRIVDNKNALEFKEISRKSGGIEIKAELSDIETGISFLKKLGFNEAFTISKSREIYSYKGFEISLDTVNELGKFIEIEKAVDSPEKKDNAKEECARLLNIISPGSKIETKKYGDLMQEIINKKK